MIHADVNIFQVIIYIFGGFWMLWPLLIIFGDEEQTPYIWLFALLNNRNPEEDGFSWKSWVIWFSGIFIMMYLGSIFNY